MAVIKYPPTSIYANTPIQNWYLDIWEPRSIRETGTDVAYEIPTEFHLRPDLAAFSFYGNEKYWYVFALRNKNILIDPIFDFKAGVQIFIPSKSAIQGLG
jgi:hypothetical protein